jgi:hypothetical protein
MILVAIDPGYAVRDNGCAVAVIDGGLLVSARFLRPEHASSEDLCVGASLVVWECPQVDARTRVSTPHVVRLAAVGGTLAGMYAGACGARCEPVAPSTWKGSAPKPVHHARLWESLYESERILLGGQPTWDRIHEARIAGAKERWAKSGAQYYARGWTLHNLLDAVGIGMWRIGR